ncbi:MAG TPA: hypothetical protein VHC86_04315 [Opitutaceae bacterium]|nr:hypothetical protein [Opitutaceae bacterium]
MEFALLFPLRGRGPAPGLLRGAALGALAAMAAFSARAAEPPPPAGWVARWDEPGADQIPPLRLARGSLVDAVAFSAAYLRAAPDEDCVVLTRRRGRELLGTAVYTRGPELRARGASGQPLRLPGLAAADINRPDRMRPALAQLDAELAAGAAGADGAEDAQLERAASALAFFPCAAGEVVLPEERADGSIAMARRRMLALDWGGKHLLWSPATGAIAFEPPLDPLTGTPYLCAEFPELLESVRFVAEYRRAHPGERAELLVSAAAYAHSHGLARAGVALAAYSAGPGVWLHTLLGAVPLPRARPEEIDPGPAFAERAFAAAARWRAGHPAQRALAPPRLPGDTPGLQLRRALLQLQTTEAREVAVRGLPRLIVEWDSRQYVYANNGSGRGAGYVGWNPRYLPLLLDGLLFAADYARRFPGEKAVVVAHPPQGRISYPAGKVNAHVYYTKGAELWGHAAENHAGEYRVAGAGAADLGRPGRIEALCRSDPGFDRMLRDFNARFLAGDYLRPIGNVPAFDPAPFSPATLRARLAAAGVACALAPHRERSEDGQIREFPDEALLFRWSGALFAYAREKVYRARSLGYPETALLP